MHMFFFVPLCLADLIYVTKLTLNLQHALWSLVLNPAPQDWINIWWGLTFFAKKAHESLVAFSQAVGHRTQSLESCWDQEGDNYIYNLHVFTPMCSAPWNKGYNKSSDPKSDPLYDYLCHQGVYLIYTIYINCFTGIAWSNNTSEERSRKNMKHHFLHQQEWGLSDFSRQSTMTHFRR